MAVLAAGQHARELYECSVCLDDDMTLKRPRVLACSHSFCQSCLTSIKNGQAITCPICRKKTNLGNGSVESIPINSQILKFKDREKELARNMNTVCWICFQRGDTKPASHRCHNCFGYLCKECSSFHGFVAAFEGHDIQEIDISETYSDIKCNLHEINHKFICLTCGVRICMQCVYGPDHRNHCDTVFPTDEGTEKLQRELDDKHNESITMLEKLEGKISENIDLLEDFEQIELKLVRERDEDSGKLMDINYRLSMIRIMRDSQDDDDLRAQILKAESEKQTRSITDDSDDSEDEYEIADESSLNKSKVIIEDKISQCDSALKDTVLVVKSLIESFLFKAKEARQRMCTLIRSIDTVRQGGREEIVESILQIRADADEIVKDVERVLPIDVLSPAYK